MAHTGLMCGLAEFKLVCPLKVRYAPFLPEMSDIHYLGINVRFASFEVSLSALAPRFRSTASIPCAKWTLL